MGPGFCPDFLRSATSRTRCWPLLKECQLRPRRGKIRYLLPAAALCRRKGKVSGSPGFTKPGADQGFDPPALLTAMDAPQALGVVGDFSARSAEEAPLLTVLQISTSSLCFWGAEPPVFRRIFALCPVFTRRVGYLPYPREKNGTQGRQRLLLFFTVVVCTVPEVYFQLQTGIFQVPQRLFEFRSSTAEEAKQYRCYTSVTAL